MLGDLDESNDAKALADKTGYSRAQFDRISRKELGGPAMTVRRRLLLERAAFQLTRTQQSVTEIAFDAGFESLEGFCRAFRSAFGVSAKRFRTLASTDFRIGFPQRIHYAESSSTSYLQDSNMSVLQLLINHHHQEVHRFLQLAGNLPEADLDKPIAAYEVQPWLDPGLTLRQALGRASAYAAPWLDTICGEQHPYEPATLEEMVDANNKNRDGFLALVESIERDRSFDLTFVDAKCDPPEVFSYAGVIAHALTFATYKRMAVSEAFRALGLKDFRVSDPIITDRELRARAAG